MATGFPRSDRGEQTPGRAASSAVRSSLEHSEPRDADRVLMRTLKRLLFSPLWSGSQTPPRCHLCGGVLVRPRSPVIVDYADWPPADRGHTDQAPRSPGTNASPRRAPRCRLRASLLTWTCRLFCRLRWRTDRHVAVARARGRLAQ